MQNYIHKLAIFCAYILLPYNIFTQNIIDIGEHLIYTLADTFSVEIGNIDTLCTYKVGDKIIVAENVYFSIDLQNIQKQHDKSIQVISYPIKIWNRTRDTLIISTSTNTGAAVFEVKPQVILPQKLGVGIYYQYIPTVSGKSFPVGSNYNANLRIDLKGNRLLEILIFFHAYFF